MISYLISFLTGTFPYSDDFQALFMALQGVMKVKNGINKKGQMNWFHAFLHGVVLSYAGGIFTPLWMGKATSMISNDVNIASCIIAYAFVNCFPKNIGYNIASLFPIRLLTVMGAQLFRTMGIIKFVDIAFNAFKGTPAKYFFGFTYPNPILGPILNGMILGNMGSFFALGFDGHLKDEMPLPFKNGLFVSSFYHVLANDDGPIGDYMRTILQPLTMGLSFDQFAVVVGSLFMQVWAILQMPEFLGPSFDPFNVFYNNRLTIVSAVQIELTSASTEAASIQNDGDGKTKNKPKKE